MKLIKITIHQDDGAQVCRYCGAILAVGTKAFSDLHSGQVFCSVVHVTEFEKDAVQIAINEADRVGSSLNDVYVRSHR